MATGVPRGAAPGTGGPDVPGGVVNVLTGRTADQIVAARRAAE